MIKQLMMAGFGLICAMHSHANNHPTLPQVGEAPCAKTVPPSALDKITLVNDFSPKQSQNLESTQDWGSDRQIVLISRPSGKYEYKFRFAKFHRKHKQFYIAKHTPYALALSAEGDSPIIHEHFGITDENGYTQSVVMDFPLKSDNDAMVGDIRLFIWEFIDFHHGYGTNLPKNQLKNYGVIGLAQLYQPYSNARVPVVSVYRCPNKADQYAFALTDYMGNVHSVNTADECGIDYFYIFDKKHGQDENKHTYKK